MNRCTQEQRAPEESVLARYASPRLIAAAMGLSTPQARTLWTIAIESLGTDAQIADRLRDQSCAERGVERLPPGWGRHLRGIVAATAATRQVHRDRLAARAVDVAFTVEQRRQLVYDRVVVPLVLEAYKKCGYRRAAHGHSTLIEWAAPAAGAARGRTFPYRGTYRTYSAITSIHTISVPPGWVRRVHERGLAVVDEHLVLDVREVEWPGDAEYLPTMATFVEAVVVVQGRGTAIEIDTRRIVVNADGTPHLAAVPTGPARGPGMRRRRRTSWERLVVRRAS